MMQSEMTRKRKRDDNERTHWSENENENERKKKHTQNATLCDSNSGCFALVFISLELSLSREFFSESSAKVKAMSFQLLCTYLDRSWPLYILHQEYGLAVEVHLIVMPLHCNGISFSNASTLLSYDWESKRERLREWKSRIERANETKNFCFLKCKEQEHNSKIFQMSFFQVFSIFSLLEYENMEILIGIIVPINGIGYREYN